MAQQKNKYGYPTIPEHPKKKGFVDFDKFMELFLPYKGLSKSSKSPIKFYRNENMAKKKTY
jgi:hypothetical protein